MEELIEKRGPGRPPLHRAEARVDDPREAAKARAAQIMEHMGSLDENSDEFYIPPEIIPDGWTYEWKAYAVLGAVDPSRQIEQERMGWQPVFTAKHPEMMPHGSTEKIIMRKGCMLMQRPQEITDMVKARDKRNAIEQIRNKEAALTAAPAGTLERMNKDNPLVKINKSFRAMPVAD